MAIRNSMLMLTASKANITILNYQYGDYVKIIIYLIVFQVDYERVKKLVGK